MKSRQNCSGNNSLEILFCLPFRIKIELHFSLIAAAVTYIMWRNVGNDKIKELDEGGSASGTSKRLKGSSDDNVDPKKRRGYWRVDCQSASKGLFLGLLCLVGGIIILIIFFVMKVYQNRCNSYLTNFTNYFCTAK